ncbi:hypothetical protein PR202_gb24802 [Eleusine coracana subsp. coracana]|uniref:Uncharacterized protein n=1 Tax=Eleusine coracana subsp. coracana TaxID=191504 RepID=A0AAV5FLY6_ELECO|nr:hypothetical protein PR202_gb24802 [Eleusine coracana subsp. coracana]
MHFRISFNDFIAYCSHRRSFESFPRLVALHNVFVASPRTAHSTAHKHRNTAIGLREDHESDVEESWVSNDEAGGMKTYDDTDVSDHEEAAGDNNVAGEDIAAAVDEFDDGY